MPEKLNQTTRQITPKNTMTVIISLRIFIIKPLRRNATRGLLTLTTTAYIWYPIRRIFVYLLPTIIRKSNQTSSLLTLRNKIQISDEAICLNCNKRYQYYNESLRLVKYRLSLNTPTFKTSFFEVWWLIKTDSLVTKNWYGNYGSYLVTRWLYLRVVVIYKKRSFLYGLRLSTADLGRPITRYRHIEGKLNNWLVNRYKVVNQSKAINYFIAFVPRE